MVRNCCAADPDPTSAKKRKGKKLVVQFPFVVKHFTYLKWFYFCTGKEKKLSQFTKNLSICIYKPKILRNIGWGPRTRDPRSWIQDTEKNLSRIQIYGVRKAPDTGSATLKPHKHVCLYKNPYPRLLPSQVISCGLESVRRISIWSAGLSSSHRASRGEAAARTNLNISGIF